MASKKKQDGVSMTQLDEPLPLVTVDSKGKFVVGSESINLISQIKGDIAVISVAGIYRTGKSYILNRLLGRQQGFAVGPTVNPCTKGIYVWGRPIVLDRPGQEPLNVLLVDTEGIGSLQQDQTYDVKIFSLAILLSSYFIYNSMAIIDERALDGLSLVVNLTQQISAKSNSSPAVGIKSGSNPNLKKKGSAVNSSAAPNNPSDLAEYFPNFLWLLRDFALELEDEDGTPITPKQYLENALRERSDGASQSKNQIRTAIKQLFRNRDCVTLVRPVSDEKQLKSIDSIPYSNLRPEFREQSAMLVDKILQEAPPKQIHGQTLNGASFVQLLNLYTEAINSGAVASIQSAWDSLSSQVNQAAMKEAFDTWKSGIAAKYNPNRPLGDDLLHNLHVECLNEALGIFDAMSYQGGNQSQLKKELKAKLGEEYKHLIQSNREASTRYVSRILATLYTPVEASIKAGKYTTVSQLVDAWFDVKNLYFEQIGDAQASKAVAYDEFIKFFTTHFPNTCTIVTGQIEQKYAANLEELRKEVARLTNEKHKSELDSVKAIEEGKRLASLLEASTKREKQLSSDNTKMRADNDKLKSDGDKLRTEVDKLKIEVDKERKASSAMQTQFERTQNESIKLKQDLKEAKELVQQQQSKLQAASETQEANSKQLNAEIQQLKGQIAQLNNTNVSLKKNLESNEMTSGSQKKEMKALKDALDAKQAELIAQQTSAKTSLDELKIASVQLKTAQSELKSLKAELSTHQQSNTSLSAQLVELSAQLVELRQQISSLENEKASLNSILQASDSKAKKIPELLQQISTLENELEKAKNLGSQNSQIKNDLTKAVNEKKTLLAEKDKLAAKLAHLESKAEMLTEEVTSMRQKLSSESNSHAEVISTMQAEIEHLQHELEAAQSAILAHREHVNHQAPEYSNHNNHDTSYDNDVVMEEVQSEAEEPVEQPPKKAPKKSRAAKPAAAVEQVNSPLPKAKAASKASQPKATPSKAKSSAKQEEEIDDLPAPTSSRKRARPDDSADDLAGLAGAPPEKKARGDPKKMTTAELMSTLTELKVKLPTEKQSKAFYVQLYEKEALKKK